MKLMSLKKKSKAPLSAQAAIAAGGLLLTWGYRRWSRRKAKRSQAEGRSRSADVQAKADRLAEKFHSLDQEAQSGHIPKDLEKEPKNLEQSTHPG